MYVKSKMVSVWDVKWFHWMTNMLVPIVYCERILMGNKFAENLLVATHDYFFLERTTYKKKWILSAESRK